MTGLFEHYEEKALAHLSAGSNDGLVYAVLALAHAIRGELVDEPPVEIVWDRES